MEEEAGVEVGGGFGDDVFDAGAVSVPLAGWKVIRGDGDNADLDV